MRIRECGFAHLRYLPPSRAPPIDRFTSSGRSPLSPLQSVPRRTDTRTTSDRTHRIRTRAYLIREAFAPQEPLGAPLVRAFASFFRRYFRANFSPSSADPVSVVRIPPAPPPGSVVGLQPTSISPRLVESLRLEFASHLVERAPPARAIQAPVTRPSRLEALEFTATTFTFARVVRHVAPAPVRRSYRASPHFSPLLTATLLVLLERLHHAIATGCRGFPTSSSIADPATLSRPSPECYDRGQRELLR